MELSLELESEEDITLVCRNAEAEALRLIARAEQHSASLKIKLQLKGFSRDIAKIAIDTLVGKGLLCDSQYAERWIRSKISCGKAKSPKYLRAHLWRKGIAPEDVNKAMEKVLDFETEYNVLTDFIKKNPSLQVRKADLRREGFSALVIDRYFEEEL